MAKKERLNEEAALNGNLHSSTLQMHENVAVQEQKSKSAKRKGNNK
jgi:hypothetical protein